MLDRNSVMVNIEMAERDIPYCSCGAPTSPIGRDGQIWLECVSLSEERTEGPLGRIFRFLTEPAHVRELIIENELAA
jgi:hypothetical protein